MSKRNHTDGTNQHPHSTVYRTAPAAFKPFRDKKVPMKGVVPCPTCGAGVDEPCVTSTGRHVVHGSRRRMALRALRKAQERQEDAS